MFKDSENGIFSRIGSKLQTLAYIILWFGMIGSVILAIVFFSSDVPGSSLSGWIALICGCFGSWISGCICYGIGTAAENRVDTLQMIVADLTRQVNDLQKTLKKYLAHHEPNTEKKEQAIEQPEKKEQKPVPGFMSVLKKQTDTSAENLIWEDDGPLYKVCPQCQASISVKYLEANKACMHCGCVYRSEKKQL